MFNLYSILRFLFFAWMLLHVGWASGQGSTKADCDQLVKLGIKALDKNELTRSLELLSKARSLAKDNGWSHQEFMASNYIGTNYYRLSEFGEALNYYLEAYTIAIKKLTPEDETLVLNNIAILYFEGNKYDQARDYFKRVYSNAKKGKAYYMAGVAALNLGTLAVATNDIDIARTYYKDALVLLAEKPQDVVLVKGGLANCDLLQGKTEKARKAAQYLLENTKNLEYYHTDIELMLIIAKSYLKENKPELALHHIEEIFKKNPKPETKVELFKLLTEINIKRKRPDLALQYKDSIFETTATINAVRNEKLYENGKVKFELQNYKNQSALNEARLVSERKIFYSALLFIIIILGLVIWLVRNVALKHKQKKLIAERNEQILALELEKEKRELELLEKQYNENKAVSMQQQEKLKSEVELKNRKLSAKALHLSGRNEIIEEILSELSVLPQVAKDKSLLSHMQSLKNQIKSDNEWDNFIKHFEEVNQGFLNALLSKHPSLNTNDIRYICYRYMNLSTKEIASMLNITQDSCRKRKERVYSKMNLPTEANLYDYLQSL